MKIDAPCNSQISALRCLWKEAFGDTDKFLNNFHKTAFSPKRCRCITIAGEMAAALYWFNCLYLGKPVAYLYAVATAEKFRGQGLCHKLMEDTHQHLKTLGYEGVILVPGNAELFKLYEGMGYQTCSHIREFRCPIQGPAQTVSVPLRSIDKAEYAALRRHFLPDNSVLQENENLDFLETQAKFYTGPGFLLTARRDTNILEGMELLGDITATPGIVRSLGYTEGNFRTPGISSEMPGLGLETPFAMYHHLGESKVPLPVYFGLAFD